MMHEWMVAMTAVAVALWNINGALDVREAAARRLLSHPCYETDVLISLSLEDSRLGPIVLAVGGGRWWAAAADFRLARALFLCDSLVGVVAVGGATACVVGRFEVHASHKADTMSWKVCRKERWKKTRQRGTRRKIESGFQNEWKV